MTAAEVQSAINEIPCDLCYMSPGLVQYAVLAAMLDIANGDPVPADTQALISEANCLLCLVPPGLVPYLQIQALRDISSGIGTSCCHVGAGPPAAALGSSGNVYWDTTNRDFYVKDGATWTLIVDVL